MWITEVHMYCCAVMLISTKYKFVPYFQASYGRLEIEREKRRGTLLVVRHCGSFVVLLIHMEGCTGNPRMDFPLQLLHTLQLYACMKEVIVSLSATLVEEMRNPVENF